MTSPYDNYSGVPQCYFFSVASRFDIGVDSDSDS